MTAPANSNVILMRSGQMAEMGQGIPKTTVLFAVADDEGLAEVAMVVEALERRGQFRVPVAHAAATPGDGVARVAKVDHALGITAGTHAERGAAALIAFEALVLETRPDVVLVAGEDDVVVAAALAAVKLEVAVARLGAGLRCWDWTLPDEVDRAVADRLADTLFTCNEEAAGNLRAEGVPDGRIYAVGNTRIDLLRRHEAAARAAAAWRACDVQEHGYTLVTLHRAASVATAGRVAAIAAALGELAQAGPVLLVQHPSTRAVLEGDDARALLAAAGVRSVDPRDYVERLSLMAAAGAIVTDAGTVQEESSALGIRCFSLGRTTAHTITLTHGTNALLGDDPSEISAVRPSRRAPTPAAIPMWDGRASERVADALAANYSLASAFASYSS
jgi:UDP-N-acetylglucosamine 2-epimerase (non-hydrolysing)